MRNRDHIKWRVNQPEDSLKNKGMSLQKDLMELAMHRGLHSIIHDLTVAASKIDTKGNQLVALIPDLPESTLSRRIAVVGRLVQPATIHAKRINGKGKAAAPKKRRRSKLSVEGRAAIVAAQKTRWAKFRKANPATK